ncbi:hypothetical protein CV102_03000 [Natronococcus pandeyae]|uniref:Uncharacterized protein n=1 Tax=Natronococcus pandeyae TaxID=2055836 RepID=A0A8J8TU77_9EURY|nr:hypothetical protein [Natronococcus pandeyae]TYL40552.1 hypothetical protein CV102_03000 [Natronococcus pandeyae]
MPSGYSRRQLVGTALGGAGAVLAGGYTWNQYATRRHLRFRPLEAVNESADAITLEITVEREGFESPRTVLLEPVGNEGDDDRSRLPGRWTKHADEWTIRAEHGEQRLELEAAVITDRLEGAGWGPDCAHVTIVVTATGDLESRIAPSETC